MDIYELIREAGLPTADENPHELLSVLRNECLLRRLHMVLDTADAQDSLTTVKLDKDLGELFKQQGRIEGLRMAVDMIVEGLKKDD